MDSTSYMAYMHNAKLSKKWTPKFPLILALELFFLGCRLTIASVTWMNSPASVTAAPSSHRGQLQRHWNTQENVNASITHEFCSTLESIAAD